MLRNADGGGGVSHFPGKRYEGVRFNVISVTKGVWVRVQFPGKKRYVTLEWPHGPWEWDTVTDTLIHFEV